MRKGKGKLTYKQLRDDYECLRKENVKLRNDLQVLQLLGWRCE